VSGGLLWVRGDPCARRYGVGGARGVRAVDVDCTLDAPAPHLLDLIVVELQEFTRKHLGKTPRVVCTDSSRDKGGGCYKNSWHIILHDIGGFRNGATEGSKGGDMRLFFEAFVASMGEELKRLPVDTWDMSVYNKNSNMRCIGRLTNFLKLPTRTTTWLADTTSF
jgi:hypothetical protein